jgi:hypothetical protein
VRAINNFNGSALILDEAFALQSRGREADAGAVRAQHFREKIVSDGQIFFLDAVLGHQEPAREATLHVMETIAGSGLGHLHGKKN